MCIATPHFRAEEFVPEKLSALAKPQTAIAKDAQQIALIEYAIKRIPTRHE